MESYDRLEVLFWTIFDQKSGNLQTIISRKQKKIASPKFLPLLFNISKRYPA
jgi:hypothetical protein